MSRAICMCGHDVDDHSDFYCMHCSCSHSRVMVLRLIDSDGIRKAAMKLAAAEVAKQLQPVVINEERRTA